MFVGLTIYFLSSAGAHILSDAVAIATVHAPRNGLAHLSPSAISHLRAMLELHAPGLAAVIAGIHHLDQRPLLLLVRDDAVAELKLFVFVLKPLTPGARPPTTTLLVTIHPSSFQACLVVAIGRAREITVHRFR